MLSVSETESRNLLRLWEVPGLSLREQTAQSDRLRQKQELVFKLYLNAAAVAASDLEGQQEAGV